MSTLRSTWILASTSAVVMLSSGCPGESKLQEHWLDLRPQAPRDNVVDAGPKPSLPHDGGWRFELRLDAPSPEPSDSGAADAPDASATDSGATDGGAADAGAADAGPDYDASIDLDRDCPRRW